MSPNPSDILAALKQGHAYITFAPDGPSLEVNAGLAGAGAILGDTVAWPEVQELEINAGGLQAGDVVRVVTAQHRTPILEVPSAGSLHASYRMDSPGFARIEVLRSFLPGLPPLPALISNPIYFENPGES
jgi:hypothetical protein